MKRVHVYVAQYNMVEKITFLYFVVEMGPNLFSGHYIGSIFHSFEKPKPIFKVKAILLFMLLISTVLFQTVQRVSPKSASHHGEFGCLCWQTSKN